MKIITKLILVLALLTSSTVFSQWLPIGTTTGKINSFYKNGITVYACYGSGTSGGVSQTTNEGVTWTSFGPMLGGTACYSLAIKNTNSTVAGCEAGIKYYSTIYTYFVISNVTWSTHSVLFDGTYYYAGTSAGVYKSTNDGANWTGLGLNATDVVSLVKSGNNMWAGCINGVYYSTDAGGNWTLSTLGGAAVNTILFDNTNSNLWVGTNQRLYRSTTGGQSFSIVNSDTAYSITINGGYMFEGVQRGVKRIIEIAPGIYQTATRNGGFSNPAPTVYSVVATNNYLLAGTASGMWRAPYNYVTEVEKIPIEIPMKYSLSQNYPNPFNPSTTIKYQIPKEQIVVLKVFDIIGKEIESLVNKKQLPGTYEVIWDASRFASGVYFYKLETKDFVEVKSMILIK